MKKQLTRLLSLVLVLALTLSLFAIIPQSAAAAESANYEEEVYRSLLEQFGGDAEQAQHTLDVMRQVGLLDDENSFYETAKVRLGGELLSLSEVSQRIAEGANLDRTVYVNDYPLPLRDLKTIIEIEEFIQYVKKNYIDNKVELTDEHYRYIGSLASALESGSVML
ncbi:MAG: hypothetical protein LBN02_08170, partial [Oscillospiraceae bacterium]|nr:hypothetical protein [Oscillospiraceae bacterium]